MCSSIWLQKLILILAGCSGGLVVAGGVFTIFTAVGLVPRFADRVKGGGHILLYENMIVAGVLLGLLYSVYLDKMGQLAESVRMLARQAGALVWTIVDAAQYATVIGYGFLTGCYVGCLALSIAEILDAIPIMARRVNLKRGIGFVVLCFALGKLAGSLFYYGFCFYKSGS